MLEKIDLSQKVKKKDYKAQMPDLRDKLYHLQNEVRKMQVPVMIVFEGWDAAGKTPTIVNLARRLDPRGYKHHAIRPARTSEKKYPWLWRYWQKIPAYGEMAIFDRSWYGRVLVERVEGLVAQDDWNRAYQDIVDFERTLAHDNTVIIKFWLHISKKEQKKRFKKMEQDPLQAWQVTEEDWAHHRNWKQYRIAVEEMLMKTDTEWGPWTIIPATNKRYTRIAVYSTIIHTLEARLNAISDARAATTLETEPA
jgi:polyphosphate kinase 2 (PPK2 family)